MKMLRNVAVVTFLAGLVLLTLGMVAACGSNGDDDDNGEINEFDAVSTPTSTPDVEATPEPTEPPEPTPTPYDGEVSRIIIDQFDVDSDIEIRGLNDQNQLDVPADPHNTAWYERYGTPGWGGNSVFSAHVDYFPDIRGPFHNLTDLEEGDHVTIVMDNGTEYVYEVFRMTRYHVDEIPMGRLIDAEDRPDEEEWITLITCGGDFQQTSESGSGRYLHRDVVVARLVETNEQQVANVQ